MSPEPSISVVVATFNRAAILARTIDHLLRQDIAPSTFEIVIVDDGSADDTGRVVREAVALSPVPIRYLAHSNRGPGYTQNCGIRAARSELILLVADDIFLTSGALAAHLRAHARHPDASVAILGKAVPAPELAGTGFLNSWDAYGIGRFEHLVELPCMLFWAFNISFKRQFMLDHGMFREARGRGGAPAHEDTEVGFRLGRGGMKLLYAPDALGHHYHPTTLRQAARRYHERGLNFPDLLANAPDPRLPVMFRAPRFGALGNYRRAMQDCPWLGGRERYFAWHLMRHVLRTLLFNRVTVPAVWTPLLGRTERSRGAVARLAAPFYGPLLWHYFLSGVRAAERLPMTNNADNPSTLSA